MKKVEDYLEEGCVFVEGDYCTDNLYGHIYGELHWAHSWIHCTDAFSEDEVTKFTWRNSTGTTPTYTNLVEVKQRNGTVYVDYVKNIDFTLELRDDDVVQWKPYIECELDWVLPEMEVKYIFGDDLDKDQLRNMVIISDSLKRQILELHITPDQQWPRK